MNPDAVRERYAAAARRALDGEGTGLLAGEGDAERLGAVHYTGEEIPAEVSAASLGCGNPLAVADLHPGETVLDLGSGGGLDVLLSARRVGPTGRAIGLDMTDEMLALARRHAEQADVGNVEFVKGTIEDIPLPAASVDVVISNCVIALSPDKPAVFAEIARVLRPGGRLGITDILADDTLTDAERTDAVECLSGALTASRYRALLRDAGLAGIDIRVTHEVGDKLHSAIIRADRPAPVRIDTMTSDHGGEVLTIYQAGLDGGHASFETTAPDWATWDATHLPDHRLVALDPAGRVLGWTAVSAVSSRCVYAGVVEHSVYVHPNAQGRGIGRALLRALVASTEAAGIWTIQSGIFPENTASRALHRGAGFREVGTRERIGRHHGQWRDVVMIERRTQRLRS
ncbi:L-amino acid N-acyltransferase YncA/2-polyprenyl-3-methyl-5-hydroxy-6-metoxy-1,4-benzoquinol methylase [Amycolatopsis lexingtonensis]|uniref:Arsenite methyltransferase n=1 Tax=Amycolatopsis lexingtonensis TaxID=218822 RepID=A0ABR9I926_9PSEU|nr:L-amino acid N-acyltransferase YncA/2-polyprenyl-3-methyl-5-hydroxy-6-metoxy-1,4-benzoquinol methylase [Amycolatopsis lexingtonensis]